MSWDIKIDDGTPGDRVIADVIAAKTAKFPAAADEVKEQIDAAVQALGEIVKALQPDPRWPAKCDKCEFQFAPGEIHQFFYDLLYRRVDTGAVLTLRGAPPGAMWDAWWLHGLHGATHDASDGRNLMVKCPNGRDWNI